MKASTLSVLLTGSNSIHMYAKKGRESCNLSVRFDKGDEAMICGFPQDWLIHNVNVDYYDYESPMGRDIELDFKDGEYPQFTTYISPDDEIDILRAAIRGIKRQAKDDMFKTHSTAEYRAECIAKLEKAIEALKLEAEVA